MKAIISIFLACVLLTLPAQAQWSGILGSSRSAPPPAGTALITGKTLGTTHHDFDGHIGFRFTVGAADVVVSQLGMWVVSGNSASHTVSIRDSGGSVVASASISTSGASVGFKYGSAAVTLTHGQDYYLLVSEVNAGDDWYGNDTTITVTSAATVVGSCYSSTSTGVPSTNAFSSVSYGPVDLKYTSP